MSRHFRAIFAQVSEKGLRGDVRVYVRVWARQHLEALVELARIYRRYLRRRRLSVVSSDIGMYIGNSDLPCYLLLTMYSDCVNFTETYAAMYAIDIMRLWDICVA